MLFLLFQLGADRYVLPVQHIHEVLPMVGLKEIPQALPGVAGVFNFRGEPVPVLDLNQFMVGRQSRPSLSTRIMLVRFKEHLLGLIAEGVTETLRKEPSDFVDSGVASAPYLGPVATDSRGVIQWVELERLLPEAIQEILFRKTGVNA